MHLLRHRAEQSPEHGLLYLDDGESQEVFLSYGELDRKARSNAASLQRVTKPGDRALMLFSPGVEAAVALFGALYAGLVVVPVPLPRPGQPTAELAAFYRDAEPSVVLIARETEPFVRSVLTSIRADPIPLVAVDECVLDPEEWAPFVPNAATLAFLLYTSGSTSDPRGVMRTYRYVMATLDVLHTADRPKDDGVRPSVAWAPLSHVLGLFSGLLGPMYDHQPSIVLSPQSVVSKPIRWLRAISKYHAHTSFAPNFLYQACVDAVTHEERAGLDLSAWRFASFAAEPVRPETIEQFSATYAPYGFRRAAFRTIYSLSEGIATRSRAVHVLRVDREALADGRVVVDRLERSSNQALVSCGEPWPGQDLRIVEPESTVELGEDAVGEIWVRGPGIADGYWRQPEATARTFHAQLAHSYEGPYLRTGDLGFVHEGQLYVAGRLKDVIIVRGKNYHAVDLERVAEQAHPALLPAGSAAIAIDENQEERIILIHELRADATHVNASDVGRAVRRAIGQTFGLPVHAVVLVEPGSLPRTSTGKIRRFRCRELYLEQSSQASA